MSVYSVGSFDPDWDVIVATDASNYVSASILSQYNHDNILHPISYIPKKHCPAEYNYKIYN
jgi:hypothetical protein